MLLLGHAAGRVGLLQRPEWLAARLPWIRRIGFTLGIPGAIVLTVAALYTPGQPVEQAALAINTLTAPLLAAAFAASLLGLAARPGAGTWLQDLVAPAGRMTLTHYLGQSMIGCLLYTSYGLNLGGSLPAAVVIGLAVLTFTLQIALSRAWLRSYAYGPAEWLLRAVTRWEKPPWRRPAVAAAGG